MRKASDPKAPAKGHGSQPAYKPTPASIILVLLATGLLLVFWLVA